MAHTLRVLGEYNAAIQEGRIVTGDDLDKFCVIYAGKIFKRFDTLVAAERYVEASHLMCGIYCPDTKMVKIHRPR